MSTSVGRGPSPWHTADRRGIRSGPRGIVRAVTEPSRRPSARRARASPTTSAPRRGPTLPRRPGPAHRSPTAVRHHRRAGRSGRRSRPSICAGGPTPPSRTSSPGDRPTAGSTPGSPPSNATSPPGGGVLAAALAFRLFIFMVPFVFVIITAFPFVGDASDKDPTRTWPTSSGWRASSPPRSRVPTAVVLEPTVALLGAGLFASCSPAAASCGCCASPTGSPGTPGSPSCAGRPVPHSSLIARGLRDRPLRRLDQQAPGPGRDRSG